MSKLFIVATPIGNLGDISHRALETLKSVDLIACEDTRNSLKLLSHYGISKPLISYYDAVEERKSEELLDTLSSGRSVALISDSVMPLISDPGFRIVRKAREAGIEVDVIPGPSAFVNALIMSGLPVDRFVFLGFLPQKVSKKIRILDEVRDFEGTVILYESPWQLKKTLTFLAEKVKIERISVARELTKLHQEVISGTMDEVMAKLGEKELKGEFVILYKKTEKA